MKGVCFLLPEGTLKLSSLFAAIEIFEKANEFSVSRGRKIFYDIKLVGVNLTQHLLNSKFAIETNNITDLSRPDLIIITGLDEQNNYSLTKNIHIIEWVVNQYLAGTELAILCTGAFLLAATGMLKTGNVLRTGKQSTLL